MPYLNLSSQTLAGYLTLVQTLYEGTEIHISKPEICGHKPAAEGKNLITIITYVCTCI
jgi:hypothetical protein